MKGYDEDWLPCDLMRIHLRSTRCNAKNQEKALAQPASDSGATNHKSDSAAQNALIIPPPAEPSGDTATGASLIVSDQFANH